MFGARFLLVVATIGSASLLSLSLLPFPQYVLCAVSQVRGFGVDGIDICDMQSDLQRELPKNVIFTNFMNCCHSAV